MIWQALERQNSPREYLRTTQGRQWSYDQAYHEVGDRRAALTKWGVKKGHRLALKIGEPGEFILWFLAALSSDVIVVPINPAAPYDDVQRTLEKSRSHFVFDGEHPPAYVMGPMARRESAGGVILLTSGSTGDPKPVGLSQSALWHTAQQVVLAHKLTPSDRGFSPLPLFHINALVVAVLGTLAAGGGLMVSNGFHARTFWEDVESYQATWLNLVPSILQVLSQRGEGPTHPENIRFIRSASAPLAAATREHMESRFAIGIVETYGMTEAGSQICANCLPGEHPKPGSVGLPRGIEVRVVNAAGEEVPVGVQGSVQIRGAGVIDPAWGSNRWALREMHEGWYNTGDLGYLDAEGFLFLAGRSRDIINRGGEKIFPREVEEWLMRHPMVQDCAVVGRPHQILGEEPVAFVVLDDPNQSEASGLGEWASQGLARFKQPAAYFVVTSLPKGSTGKVSRQHLRQQMHEGGGL